MESYKKTIVFDLDDVLVKGGFLSIANEVFGENKTEEEIKSYFVEDNYKNIREKREIYLDAIATRNVYENAVFVEGARDIVKKYSEDKRFEVFIKSASVIREREELSGKLFSDKYELILRSFPFVEPDNIIFTGNVSILNPDFYIDDRLENLEKSRAKYKFLFTAPHNRRLTEEEISMNHVVRVDSHKQIDRIISIIKLFSV